MSNLSFFHVVACFYAAHRKRGQRLRRRTPLAWLMLFLVGSSLLVPAAQPVYAINAPDPLLPPNGTTTTVSNYPPLGIPEFTWSSVTGATAYRVQFSLDIGFATIPFLKS